MNTKLDVAADLLRASADDRTLTYRLLPYTAGRTSKGKVTASAGCITLPDNPAELALNDRHISDRILGHGQTLAWETDGLIASIQELLK